jgi:guanylate kinase
MSYFKTVLGMVTLMLFNYALAETKDLSISQKIERKNLIIILSAPSGTGKSTLVNKLLKDDPIYIKPLSITTRKPRPGEVMDKDYHFISKEEFDKRDANNEFIENMALYGNHYAFSRQHIEDKLALGKDLLFDGSWAGVQKIVKEKADRVVTIFLLPPSMQELESRLRGRGSDTEEMVQKRLANATQEASQHKFYDYVLVNDDVETTFKQIKTIIAAERMKRLHQTIPAL